MIAFKQAYVYIVIVLAFLPDIAKAQISLEPPAQKIAAADLRAWETEAAVMYYQVLPQSIRSDGNGEEFLYPTQKALPPKKDEEWARYTSYLCLARRDKQGHFSLVWYKELAQHEEARTAIWLPMANGKTDTLLLAMMGAQSYVYHVDQKANFQFVTHYEDYHMNLSPRYCYLANVGPTAHPHAFYAHYPLYVLDLLSGASQILLPQPVLTNTMAFFLGVADFDQDGKLDIIGEAMSVTVENKTRKKNPTTIHVWNYQGDKLKEIYAGEPMQHWAVESLLLRTGANKPPIMITNEIHELPNNRRDVYLHLYGWDGKQIHELSNSKEIVHGLFYDGYEVADLDADGIDEIVAMSGIGGTHLVIMKWDGKKLSKEWDSPVLYNGISFGRTADYDRNGKEQVVLINGNATDKGKQLAFLKYQDGKYVGWETMKYVPAIPAKRSERLLDERLNYEVELSENDEPLHTYIVLDGERIFEVQPTTTERKARYVADDLKKKIIAAVKKQIPAENVMSRRIDDETKKEPVTYMICADGKETDGVIFIKLTADDAAAYKLPLEQVVDNMRAMIYKAMATLANPKRS